LMTGIPKVCEATDEMMLKDKYTHNNVFVARHEYMSSTP
jgi:hypothetical protein